MFTVGKTDDGTNVQTFSGDRIYLSTATAGSSGTVVNGWGRVRVTSASTSEVRMVIFADNGGTPDGGAFLAMSDEVIVDWTTSTLTEFPFSGSNRISIASGTPYWIGFWADDPGVPSYEYKRDNNASVNHFATEAYPGGGTPTTPFTSGGTANGPLNAYIECLEAGTISLPTSFDTGQDTTDSSSCTTNSKSFVSGYMYHLWVVSKTEITTDPNIPTATGGGVTWTTPTNGSEVIDTTSSSRRRLTHLCGVCTSNTTGTISIDFGGQTQTTKVWAIDQFTSGFDTSTPVVQDKKNNSQTAVTSITATLDAFSSASNATYGCFGASNGTTNPLPGSGFATISVSRDATENNGGLETIFKPTNDTSVDWTFSSDSEIGCIGVELNAASAATSVKDMIYSGFIPFAR